MDLFSLLLENKQNFKPLFVPELTPENTHFLDFSVDNPALANVNLTHTPSLNSYVFGLVKENNKQYAFGGYMEDREIYRRSKLFSTGNQQARSIHLGVDIWTETEKEVHLPLDGKIHSFRNNTQFGDYGPTIIVEHKLNGTTFYTLYGHLSAESIQNISEGMDIKAGEIICHVGNFPVNGDWPPHLHFQVISDMGDKKGDFPGVCSKSEKSKYQKICPDPAVFFGNL